MSAFIGLLNNNGNINKFRIYLDLADSDPYITDFYMNNTRFYAKIERNKCKIYKENTCTGMRSLLRLICGFNYGTTYNMSIEKYNDEIIITGKEEVGNCFFCIPRLSKPKFFVATNKEEV